MCCDRGRLRAKGCLAVVVFQIHVRAIFEQDSGCASVVFFRGLHQGVEPLLSKAFTFAPCSTVLRLM